MFLASRNPGDERAVFTFDELNIERLEREHLKAYSKSTLTLTGAWVRLLLDGLDKFKLAENWYGVRGSVWQITPSHLHADLSCKSDDYRCFDGLGRLTRVDCRFVNWCVYLEDNVLMCDAVSYEGGGPQIPREVLTWLKV